MIKIDENDEFNRNDQKFVSSIAMIKNFKDEDDKFSKNL